MITKALLKPILEQAKRHLGNVNDIIVTNLQKQTVNTEAGEYAAYVILASKKGEAYLLPVVMDANDKVIITMEKEKVTDFLTNIIEQYGAK